MIIFSIESGEWNTDAEVSEVFDTYESQKGLEESKKACSSLRLGL